jgi:hypothetical protein
VNEIAKLHGGSVQLVNRMGPDGRILGAAASLRLPARLLPTDPI